MKDISGAGVAMDFARAIAPITPEVFFAEYFEKKHLVVRRDDPDYYRALLSVADIDHVLTTMQIPEADMNMVNNGTPVAPENYLSPTEHVDPVRAAQQFAEGGTIILPGLQRRLPKLASYCRSLETVFSCDLQTNIYFTPDNAQGFKTHYDGHDVIVLQTHGSKTWNIYESPMVLPLRSQAFDPATFERGEIIDTFVLNAGDMCYVPRGVVHDAIATEEMSLHITTGLLTPRWADMLIDAISEVAHRDPAFRHAVPPGFANDGFDMAGAKETFAALLARAVEQAQPEITLERYASEFRARRNPVTPGQFLQFVDAGAIGPGSTVAPRADLIYRLGRVGDGDDAEIVLDVYGTEIAFPAHVEESLRDAVTRAAPFRIGDLAGDLDDEGQAVMVRRLVREGVLEALG
jgi:ribosomal protein L16 Arg81 hydroxylase